MESEALKPCPWCGASASIEEHETSFGASFSVGCDSPNEATCMGYQSLTMFTTRKEAAKAWNRRPSSDLAEALMPFAKLADTFGGKPASGYVHVEVKINDLRRARAALSAHAGGTPDGWKLVPIEPTEEMAKRWMACGDQCMAIMWRAAVMAAPDPPSPIPPERVREKK